MNTKLKVNVAAVAPGSCFTEEQLAELRQILSVDIPDAQPAAITPNLSVEANSLARLDSAGAIEVPGVVAFGTSDVWIAGTTTELIFNGWPSTIDPTSQYCMVMLHPIFAASDDGVAVKGDPSGTKQLHGSMEITEVTSGNIKCKLRNVSRDATIYIRLIMHPIPPQKP